MNKNYLSDNDPALTMLNTYMAEEISKQVNEAVTQVWRATKEKMKPLKTKVNELEEKIERLVPLKSKVKNLEEEIKSLIEKLSNSDETVAKHLEKIEDLEHKIMIQNKTIQNHMIKPEEIQSSTESEDNITLDTDHIEANGKRSAEQDSFSDLELRLFNKKPKENVDKPAKNTVRQAPQGNDVKGVKENKRNRTLKVNTIKKEKTPVKQNKRNK